MFKVLLLAIVVFTSRSAFAQWVFFAEVPHAIVYFDTTSIVKDGFSRKVWELQDLKVRNKDGELSWRSRWEYDCKQERRRMLSFSTHSDQMAKGEILLNHGSSRPWVDIAPQTAARDTLNFLCAK
jgi:hypothetical protein